MEFKRHAPVYTADEQQVGVVDRVVLEPQTNEVSHIVIRHGWLFAEDKVAPIELIEQATAEQVLLRKDIKNLDDLPPFEEVSYLPYPDEEEAAPPPSSTSPSDQTPVAAEAEDPATTTTYTTVTDAFSLYGYPGIGMSWPSYDLGYYGYPDELYKVKVKRHIPTGTVALREGAAIVDSEGEHVGAVKRIFTNDVTGEVTHLLIAEGWIFKEERVIPLDWVKTIAEDEVQLYVKTALLKRLPEHQPA